MSPYIHSLTFVLPFCYQWDALENKSTVLLYGGGAIVAVWLSATFVGAVNSVPLVSHYTC